MGNQETLVLFGDQTVEKLSSIRSLVRNSKTSAAARRLLLDATDVLQINISKLYKKENAERQSPHTLLDFAEGNLIEKDKMGVIATVLMCIGRLGEAFIHAEQDPSILGSEETPTHILAFCTGLLPASALVAARDTAELHDIGIEIISVTFRLAHEIIRQMKMVEATERSWAMTILGKSQYEVQLILDEFHNTQGIPYPKRVAIGVISDEWLTLFGAPSSLTRLAKFSKAVNLAPKTYTDTDGAVHTHYLPRIDVEWILGNSRLLDTPITSKARLVSPHSCKNYTAATLRALLSEIVVDIAHRVLYINKTITECISKLTNEGTISLVVAGPTVHLATVQRTLKNKNFKFNIQQCKKPPNGTKGRGGSDLIAVVGMSGRFPGSETIKDFFNQLLEGQRQIQKVPKSRFDLGKYFDPTGNKKNTTSSQHGAFLENPGHFDNRLFNISPREANQMDPIQRLLLMVSYEALENAGYSKNGTLATESRRIATFFGQISEDWRDVLNNTEIDIYYVPGLSRAFGPSRLNYYYKWGGGTYALDTACATSATAIHLACSALKSRECDTALAGGGSILVSPKSYSGLSKSGMISNNEGCNTYHDDADGYARGEGIGVVILKRLEDAYADNDNILGVIAGSARTYTSTSKSITHPSAESQARVYQEILRQTAVTPNEIAFIEMHGTGTQAGDLEEMTSIINVFGKGRSSENALTVGAVKANVGHGEGAAGVTSLIKVLMMIQERKIPPQPGIPFKLNHKFPNLEDLHVHIAGFKTVNTYLNHSPDTTDGKVRCVVNSFDAAGGNTSLLIEEPPKLLTKAENPLPRHIVAISAKTSTSLQENRRKLISHLNKNPNTKIADLAYTTTARRMHQPLREAYCASSSGELLKLLLEEEKKGTLRNPKQKSVNMKLVMTFTGQSSQYRGMGRQLYQQNMAYKNLLNSYHRLALHQSLPGFLDYITNDTSEIGTESTVVIQLAIVAIEIATAQLLESWGIKPDIVLGHSLGEYSALCIANVLSVSDTLYLVGRRAKLMEENLTVDAYSMLVIPWSFQKVQQLLNSDLAYKENSMEISCINAPHVTVVSGPVGEIVAFKTGLEKIGCRATVLDVPYGFHSRHVEPILEDFDTIATGIKFSSPTIPITSTSLAEVIPVGKRGVFSSSYLKHQTRDRVNFLGAVKALEDIGIYKLDTHWLEVGPEPICTNLVHKILDMPRSQLLFTMKSKENNWVTISSTLASLYESGVSINWQTYFKDFKSTVNLIPLPNYAFDLKNFWTPYIESEPTDLHSKNHKTFKNGSNSPPINKFSTSTLQWIEKEILDDKGLAVTFASYASDRGLLEAIQGHMVSELPVCSIGIFCDMAKSATRYAFEKLSQTYNTPPMSVLNLEMTKALVVSESDPRFIIKTTVLYSVDDNKASIKFHSEHSKHKTQHGTCEVVVEESRPSFTKLSQTLFLINARIKWLKDSTNAVSVHRLLKPVVYRLFSNFVTYSREYQGVEEAWIDADCNDAVATVRLPSTTSAGSFLYNPFWIDISMHLAGFLLNSGLKDKDDTACLSTGFEDWRILGELQAGGTYTTYVTMHHTDVQNILVGSAYIYDGSQKLLQVTTGIRFFQIKKSAVNTILQPTELSTPNVNTLKPSTTGSGPFQRGPKTIDSRIKTVETEANSYFAGNEGDLPCGVPTTASVDSNMGGSSLWDTLVSIIASESASNVKDVDLNTDFSEIGLDSLMGITILATFQRDTGVELPATFFLDYPTVGNAKSLIFNEKQDKSSSQSTHNFEDYLENTSVPLVSVSDESANIQDDNTKHRNSIMDDFDSSTTGYIATPGTATSSMSVNSSRSCKIILLQGKPSSTGPKLFLLPDGTGSTYQYIHLPILGNNINVYGLESPFVKCPWEYRCSPRDISDYFLTAITSVQSVGPYNLAGFSLGAIYAYLVAQKLLNAEERIQNLILIDMAVPKNVGKSLIATHEELIDAGIVLSTRRYTKAQKENIINTIRAMTSQSLTPCPSGKSPNQTVLVSSSDRVAAASESELALWVQGHASASRGWEKMVGLVKEHNIEADASCILDPPAIETVCEIFTRVITNLNCNG